MTNSPSTDATARPWRYEIQYGPNGEKIYAWVYYHNLMVCTAKVHHARLIVEAVNAYEPLKARLAEAQEASVELQRHRDHWRGYAYGKRDRPLDFLDGNLVDADRPQTMVERALAAEDREAVARIIKNHVSVTVSGEAYAPRDNDRDGVASAADAILSLLRPAEPVEAKWRPIETAPKEDPERPGRDFEIIVGGGEIKDESADLLPWRPFDSWSLACYDSMRGCWRGEQTEQYDCFYLHKPTHWMPKFAGPGQCEPTTSDAVGEPVAWRARRLEWIERIGVDGTFDASTSIGHYIATITDDGRGMWFVVGLTTSNYIDGDISAVQFAAQSDYENRIRSAIEVAPHPHAQTNTSAAVLAERERCAAIADEWANKMALNYGRETANTIAAAIRQLPTTERGE